MGTLSNCFRIVVIVINCLFMIIGLAFFAGGLFLRFGDSLIENSVSSVETALESSLSSAGFGTVDIDLDFATMLFGLALAFTFTGLAVIAITMIGCCGSCYKIKCLLIIYIVVCSVFLIGEAVVVGLLYGSPETIQKPLKTSLKEGIQSGYGGLNGTNLVSQGWNLVMQQVGCCGVDSYDDFTGAENWAIDYTANAPPITLKTPLACCKTLPSGNDYSCAGTAASTTDNYLNTGCFGEIWDMIFGNTVLAAAILGSIGAFQLLLIVFAIVILLAERNEQKNKIRPVKQDVKPNANVRRRNNPRLMSRK